MIKIPYGVYDANGTKIEVKDGYDVLSINEVILNNDYMLEQQDFDSISTIIDAGAHIGCFSLFYYKQTSKVICIEPMPNNFARIQANIKLNNITTIIPINKALAPHSGNLPFHIANGSKRRHTLESGIAFTHTKEVREIPCIGINELFQDYQLEENCLLKLDIEGSEYNVLPIITPETWKKIKVIVMEAHEFPDKPWKHETMEGILKSQGFTVTSKKLYVAGGSRGWGIKGVRTC